MNAIKSILLFFLRAYKLTISPYLGQRCRFFPSCSTYAELAIRHHGVTKGCVLAGKRLCKCHPWHDGGVDLVPITQLNANEKTEERSVAKI
ncbi:MAG: rane protein insertion efficiency factor YidD [Solimicrobium sp.]|jgi:putative membrane protein insertion efficiency factor|nr:rane protein insertion efficiency factor YidD [Solimicrobium sp.]